MITVQGILIILLIHIIVIGIVWYLRHTRRLKPMTDQEVQELKQKFEEVFKDSNPKPAMNFIRDRNGYPAYLDLVQGSKTFLILAWDKSSSKPSVRRYSRDVCQYATHNFLDYLQITTPH